MFHPFPARRQFDRPAQLVGAGLAAVSFLAALASVPSLRAQVAASSNPTASFAPAKSAPPARTVAALDTTSSNAPSATRESERTLTEPAIIITGDELPSAYGAPGAFSRSRFSPITNGYVLPPGEVFAALIYQGDFLDEGPSDHTLTQEVEIGVPYRFGVAFENAIEFFDGDTSNRSFSIETRWALADWGKIPLNPTLFAEYKFGTGKILHEEAEEEEMIEDEDEDMPPDDEEMMREEEERGRPDQPDAYEFRLLLSEEIVKGVEWAFNAFLENEVSGDRGREWGFAQSIQMPIVLPRERLKVGLEMKYTNFTVKDTRGDPAHSFVIGPSMAYKPTARMRFDVAPLFGVTDESPDFQLFAVFSYAFGGGGEGEQAEAPASTRNR